MQQSLFNNNITANKPLASLLRPNTLEEFLGQSHIIGKNTPLFKAISNDNLFSIILYGPPGCGKTTLANIISKQTNSDFIELNATSAALKDIKVSAEQAKQNLMFYNKKTIVFIDEIHRFNKKQQDALLPFVENGTIILIGATTENPLFAIVSPLVSRCYLCEFKHLDETSLKTILFNAKKKFEHVLEKKISIDNKSIDYLIKTSNGDARNCLNIFEACIKTLNTEETNEINIDFDFLEKTLPDKIICYDKNGNEHYDTISALIKSMRGSDPDAALYWLGKMIYAREDIDFLGRRIAICASEDVGNADPHAILVANAAWEIARKTGYPEARIPLAQAVTYIATAPKSNASYKAIDKVLDDIKQNPVSEIPQYLKETPVNKDKSYKYPHTYKGNFVKQDYMKQPKKFYEPTDNGYESIIKKRLEKWEQNTGDRRQETE